MTVNNQTFDFSISNSSPNRRYDYNHAHTSDLQEGQWKIEEDNKELSQLAIIPFPILCECHTLLKRAKVTIRYTTGMTKKSNNQNNQNL